MHYCTKSYHLWFLPGFLLIVFTKIWVNAFSIAFSAYGCQCYCEDSAAGDSGASFGHMHFSANELTRLIYFRIKSEVSE